MQMENVVITDQFDAGSVMADIRKYRVTDARAILVWDKTRTAEWHEEAIGLIRSICREACLPVFGTGHVRRLEDVKKLLYAGCLAVYSDPAEPIEAALLEEAVLRFGPDRVLRGLPSLPDSAFMDWPEFRPGPDGLMPCIVQEETSGEVLMLAYMNEEAYRLTIQTGRMTYWSRSRREIWVKGLTSGHFQFVRSLAVDCDNDTLLAKVIQIGAACHTGNHSCFYRNIYQLGHPQANPQKVLQDVYAVIADRKEHPKEGSYTNYLFEQGIDKILKKVGEESAETIIAAKNPDSTESIYEIADLLYHMMVLMCEKGLTWQDITEELANRE